MIEVFVNNNGDVLAVLDTNKHLNISGDTFIGNNSSVKIFCNTYNVISKYETLGGYVYIIEEDLSE